MWNPLDAARNFPRPRLLLDNMEKLLAVRIEDQSHYNIPGELLVIQAMAHNVFNYLK